MYFRTFKNAKMIKCKIGKMQDVEDMFDLSLLNDIDSKGNLLLLNILKIAHRRDIYE
mgnify:CR=1 FL=1